MIFNSYTVSCCSNENYSVENFVVPRVITALGVWRLRSQAAWCTYMGRVICSEAVE